MAWYLLATLNEYEDYLTYCNTLLDIRQMIQGSNNP